MWKDQKYKAILSYIQSWRPVWATWDPVFKKETHTQKKKIRSLLTDSKNIKCILGYWQFLIKSKPALSVQPGNHLLWEINPREIKTYVHKHTKWICPWIFIAPLSAIVKTQGQSKCLSKHEQMVKWVLASHGETYEPAIKKNKNEVNYECNNWLGGSLGIMFTEKHQHHGLQAHVCHAWLL